MLFIDAQHALHSRATCQHPEPTILFSCRSSQPSKLVRRDQQKKVSERDSPGFRSHPGSSSPPPLQHHPRRRWRGRAGYGGHPEAGHQVPGAGRPAAAGDDAFS
jgi:hypothetical protein